MKKKETTTIKNEERLIESFFEDVKLATKFRYISIIVFGFGCLILKLTNIYPAPWIMFLLLALFGVYTALWSLIIKRIKKTKSLLRANTFYFNVQILEVFIVMAAVHFSGVVQYMGALILVVYFFHSYFPYTQRRYYVSIFIFAISIYIVTLTLEYLGILEVKDFYNTGLVVENNLGLFIVTSVLGASLMTFMFLIGDTFLRRIQKSLKFLIKKEAESTEVTSVLEVKVRARTKALEEERESLEIKIEERTEALQGKLKELESFHKLAVGRELKMIELKKELKKLKTKFKKE